MNSVLSPNALAKAWMLSIKLLSVLENHCVTAWNEINTHPYDK
jgi:hypothetical protein